MRIKHFLLFIIAIVGMTSCTKYFDGITDLDNWQLGGFNPSFGLAILNMNISYEDLKSSLPEDSNFTVGTMPVGGKEILVLKANQNIISAFNNFFTLQNLTLSQSPTIGGTANQPITVPITIPLNNLIKLDGLDENNTTIKSITFGNGTINLRINSSIVSSISSISASIGGVSSSTITPNNNNEVTVPIDLKNKTVNITGSTLNVTLNVTFNRTTSAQSNININSENLDLQDVTLSSFSYAPNKPISVEIPLGFFDKVNAGATISFPLAKLLVSFNNQANLSVSFSDLKATYFYKDGTSQEESIPVNGASQEYDIPNLSNLLTKVTFTTTPSISATTTPVTLSKSENIQLRGTVNIPLQVNIQNLVYESDLSLPNISNNSIVDAIQSATIKILSKNTFPFGLTKCELVILDNAGQRIDAIDLKGIIAENANPSSTTIDVPKEKIQSLLRSGKGKISIGMSTHNAQGVAGQGEFTTTDALNIRLGLSVKANGKDITSSLQ